MEKPHDRHQQGFCRISASTNNVAALWMLRGLYWPKNTARLEMHAGERWLPAIVLGGGTAIPSEYPIFTGPVADRRRDKRIYGRYGGN